ncbi:MAG TPA: TCR/Tet family MFS transporter [Meiothermus sp.]|nr:TCR/Tet family MFS transporter [Meiothermus sp.]
MQRQASIVFILISVLINVMGLGLVIPVLPKLIEELAGGVQAGALYNGVFIAVYAAMQFVFAPILGILSDRYGRRPVLLLSLAGTVIDYLVSAVTGSLWVLLGARIAAGILGASISTANAYIADISAPAERARNFGLIGAVFGLGFVLGPAIGGLLGNADIRLPFYFAGGLAFLNLLYGYFVLPESLRAEHRSAKKGMANPLAALAILRKTPLTSGLSVSLVLLFLAFGILQSVWVLYTTYRFHWTILETGLSLMLVGITSSLVQAGLVQLIIKRLGERRALLLGQSAGIVSFTLYGLATQGWMMYATIAIGSIGNVGGPVVQSLLSKQVSAREQGTIQGALAAIQSLTGVFGPLIGGYVFALFAKPDVAPWLVGMPFFIGAVLYFLGFLNTIWTFRRIPESPAEVPPEASFKPVPESTD